MICSLAIIGADEPWTPNFTPQPLTAQTIGATSGPVYQGALVCELHGCQDCHVIDGPPW